MVSTLPHGSFALRRSGSERSSLKTHNALARQRGLRSWWDAAAAVLEGDSEGVELAGGFSTGGSGWWGGWVHGGWVGTHRRRISVTGGSRPTLPSVVLESLEVLEGVEWGGLVEIEVEQGLAEVVVLGGEHL